MSYRPLAKDSPHSCAFCHKPLTLENDLIQPWRSPAGLFFCNEFCADDADEAASLYKKLENAVVPAYLDAPEKWAQLMRTTIAFNGSYFNTNRMVKQYTRNAYYPVKLVEHAHVEEAAYAD